MSNICKRGVYQKASPQDKKRDERFREWVRKQRCVNCNSIGEWVTEKGRAFCEAAHVTFDGKSGKAIKDLFVCVPLCHKCHEFQTLHGYESLRPKDWWREKLRECVAAWMSQECV